MSDTDRIRALEDEVRKLKAEIKDIKAQTGNQPLRIAQRSGGGGGARWSEYTGA